jgi:hypothetical protein
MIIIEAYYEILIFLGFSKSVPDSYKWKTAFRDLTKGV